MTFVLTCALCVTQPAMPWATTHDPPPLAILDRALAPPSIPEPRSLPATAIPHPWFADAGSGDGDGHGDHMTAMWVVMGAMMVVMMVAVVAYSSRHGMWSARAEPGALPSPAQLAVPVSVANMPGG